MAYQDENKQYYLYPKDMKSKPKVLAWNVRDLAIAAMLFLFGLLIAVNSGFFYVMVIGIVYALLTVQAGNNSVMDYIIYLLRYFFTQQEFRWGREKTDINAIKEDTIEKDNTKDVKS